MLYPIGYNEKETVHPMEVVYYFDEELGYCPVKEYFNQFDPSEIILPKIEDKIKFIQENNGRPIPPTAQPLRGFSFFEIKLRKNKSTLIRILYFNFVDKMVLLNVFEKPENYDTTKEKREIEKHYKITREYQQKFITHPNHYEKYNKENSRSQSGYYG